MSNRIWLTYAWKDNEDRQIDYVIGSLKSQKLEVGYDRARLIPGQRLWPQLDAAISDPNLDAWAIYATKESLNSEPCLEELAYALDRALRTRGASFPIIGIFPEPIDRSLIPSALATRLYVTLQDPDWAEKVAAGVTLTAPKTTVRPVPACLLKAYEQNGKLIIEVRPRAGRWLPCLFLVPNDERDKLLSVQYAPAERLPQVTLTLGISPVQGDDGKYSGFRIEQAVDNLNSIFATLSSSPSSIVVGQQGEELIHIKPP